MAFQKIVSVDVEHGYFNGTAVQGLSFKPTPECERLLKNHRLLLKSSDQLVILQDEDQNGLNLTPDPALAFDFFIHAPDDQFFKYTSLKSKKVDELYVFSNRLRPAALQLSITTKAGYSQATPANLLGVLQLYFNSPKPVSLSLQFEAKHLKWKYYILSGAALAEPVIETGTSDLSFKKQAKTVQDKDELFGKLATGFPKAVISVFESAAEVALNNMGRKNIRLKNAADSRIIISHLPNPDPNENGIKIINLIN